MRRLIGFLLAVFLVFAALPTVYCEGETMSEYADMITCPVNRSLEALQALGLYEENEPTERYIALHDFYCAALWTLLESRAGIEGLDKALTAHELGFLPAQEPVSAEQRLYSYGLKFFYLRSPIPLERLSAERLEKLDELRQAGEAGAEEAQAFVAETMELLLTAVPEDPEDILCVWTPGGDTAPNRSLVLGLAAGAAYDENGNMYDPEKEALKAEVLCRLVPELAKDLTEAMGFPVAILLEE